MGKSDLEFRNSRIHWFLRFELAERRGDLKALAEAATNMERLGVRVKRGPWRSRRMKSRSNDSNERGAQ